MQSGKNAVHHVMMELFSFDDVGQGYDIALNEQRVAVTLGRPRRTKRRGCVEYLLASNSGAGNHGKQRVARRLGAMNILLFVVTEHAKSSYLVPKCCEWYKKQVCCIIKTSIICPFKMPETTAGKLLKRIQKKGIMPHSELSKMGIHRKYLTVLRRSTIIKLGRGLYSATN